MAGNMERPTAGRDDGRALVEDMMQSCREEKSRDVADEGADEDQVADLGSRELPVEDVHVVRQRGADAQHHRQAEERDHEHQVVAVGERTPEIAQEAPHAERRQVIRRLRQRGDPVARKPGRREQHDEDGGGDGSRERGIRLSVQESVTRNSRGGEEDERVDLEHTGPADPAEEVVVAHDLGPLGVGGGELAAERQMRHVIEGHERPQADRPAEKPGEQSAFGETVRRAEDAVEADGNGQGGDEHERVTPAPAFGAEPVGQGPDQRIRDGVREQRNGRYQAGKEDAEALHLVVEQHAENGEGVERHGLRGRAYAEGQACSRGHAVRIHGTDPVCHPSPLRPADGSA